MRRFDYVVAMPEEYMTHATVLSRHKTIGAAERRVTRFHARGDDEAMVFYLRTKGDPRRHQTLEICVETLTARERMW